MVKSRFIEVSCPECGNKQRTFSHASTEVKCLKCGATLVKPTGGKAEITGKVSKVMG